MRAPTLLDRLLDGERAAIHFLRDADPRSIREALGRAELRAIVARRAAGLREAGIGPGDRLVLALPTGPELVTCFLGALWLGATPVPVPEPRRGVAGTAGGERLLGVVEDCQPQAVIAQARFRAALAHPSLGVPVIAPPEVSGPIPPRPVPPPETPAFVQYTAGSTGHPKGVVVTYANLEANLRGIGQAVRVSPADRVVSWLPLFHDMGLVRTLLFSLYWQIPLFLYSPLGFVLQPVSWLRAISTHRGTLSPAPHFAYSLCAHKLPERVLEGLDLSTWRLALDGAEPIRAANVRAFLGRFARYGFRPEAYHPVYGLSEATVAVTFPECGRGARFDRVARSRLGRAEAAPALAGEAAVENVSVGRPIPGVEVEIRGPVGLLGERAVGEICVRGASVTPRYLGEEGPPRELLQTGDLGYLAQGELFVVGRSKDVIIQAGANVYPSDMEGAVGGIERVRRGRVVAFGVERADEGTEAVVVAAEVHGLLHHRRLEAAIRSAVLEQCGVTIAEVVLLRPRSLPLTTSGKLMRRRVRADYLAGRLGTWRSRHAPCAGEPAEVPGQPEG